MAKHKTTPAELEAEPTQKEEEEKATPVAELEAGPTQKEEEENRAPSPMEPEIVPPVIKVALSSIPFLSMFEFEGVVYRKTSYLKNHVLVHTAAYVAGGPMLHGVSERAFDLKTLVTPK